MITSLGSNNLITPNNNPLILLYHESSKLEHQVPLTFKLSLLFVLRIQHEYKREYRKKKAVGNEFDKRRIGSIHAVHS